MIIKFEITITIFAWLCRHDRLFLLKTRLVNFDGMVLLRLGCFNFDILMRKRFGHWSNVGTVKNKQKYLSGSLVVRDCKYFSLLDFGSGQLISFML